MFSFEKYCRLVYLIRILYLIIYNICFTVTLMKLNDNNKIIVSLFYFYFVTMQVLLRSIPFHDVTGKWSFIDFPSYKSSCDHSVMMSRLCCKPRHNNFSLVCNNHKQQDKSSHCLTLVQNMIKANHLLQLPRLQSSFLDILLIIIIPLFVNIDVSCINNNGCVGFVNCLEKLS